MRKNIVIVFSRFYFQHRTFMFSQKMSKTLVASSSNTIQQFFPTDTPMRKY